MTDIFDLSGRVAIITGGAGVLGTEHARALAERGARIVLADVNQERVDAAAAMIHAEYGVETLGIELDVSVPEQVSRAVAQTLERFGRTDILVNNAAAQPPGFTAPFEEYSLEVWNRVMAVNVTGMMLMAQAVGPQMVRQGKGSIINIASIYGVAAPDQRIYDGLSFCTPAIYAVSKAGVLGLTRYLSTYWADKGVRANAITPGGVFRGHEDPFLSRYSARVRMGRMANQDEFRGAVVYLASDASSYVNGHNIMVDGGLTAW